MEIMVVIIFVVILWAFLSTSGKSRPPPADLSILPERFVVFDLETTGLDSTKHKIIEIGAIRVNRDSNKHETLRALIKIDGRVPAKITQLTGITNEMLARDGESIETALPQFLKFCGDLRLVSFNAEFDMGFLLIAAHAQGLKVPNNCSCALKMARRAWPRRRSYKLAALAGDGGFGTQNHRALGDCQLALTVYTAAASKLRRID